MPLPHRYLVPFGPKQTPHRFTDVPKVLPDPQEGSTRTAGGVKKVDTNSTEPEEGDGG